MDKLTKDYENRILHKIKKYENFKRTKPSKNIYNIKLNKYVNALKMIRGAGVTITRTLAGTSSTSPFTYNDFKDKLIDQQSNDIKIEVVDPTSTTTTTPFQTKSLERYYKQFLDGTKVNSDRDRTIGKIASLQQLGLDNRGIITKMKDNTLYVYDKLIGTIDSLRFKAIIFTIIRNIMNKINKRKLENWKLFEDLFMKGFRYTEAEVRTAITNIQSKLRSDTTALETQIATFLAGTQNSQLIFGGGYTKYKFTNFDNILVGGAVINDNNIDGYNFTKYSTGTTGTDIVDFIKSVLFTTTTTIETNTLTEFNKPNTTDKYQMDELPFFKEVYDYIIELKNEGVDAESIRQHLQSNISILDDLMLLDINVNKYNAVIKIVTKIAEVRDDMDPISTKSLTDIKGLPLYSAPLSSISGGRRGFDPNSIDTIITSIAPVTVATTPSAPSATSLAGTLKAKEEEFKTVMTSENSIIGNINKQITDARNAEISKIEKEIKDEQQQRQAEVATKKTEEGRIRGELAKINSAAVIAKAKKEREAQQEIVTNAEKLQEQVNKYTIPEINDTNISSIETTINELLKFKNLYDTQYKAISSMPTPVSTSPNTELETNKTKAKGILDKTMTVIREKANKLETNVDTYVNSIKLEQIKPEEFGKYNKIIEDLITNINSTIPNHNKIMHDKETLTVTQVEKPKTGDAGITVTAQRDAVTVPENAVTGQGDGVTAQEDDVTVPENAVTGQGDGVTAQEDDVTAQGDDETAQGNADDAETEVAGKIEEEQPTGGYKLFGGDYDTLVLSLEQLKTRIIEAKATVEAKAAAEAKAVADAKIEQARKEKEEADKKAEEEARQKEEAKAEAKTKLQPFINKLEDNKKEIESFLKEIIQKIKPTGLVEAFAGDTLDISVINSVSELGTKPVPTSDNTQLQDLRIQKVTAENDVVTTINEIIIKAQQFIINNTESQEIIDKFNSDNLDDIGEEKITNKIKNLEDTKKQLTSIESKLQEIKTLGEKIKQEEINAILRQGLTKGACIKEYIRIRPRHTKDVRTTILQLKVKSQEYNNTKLENFQNITRMKTNDYCIDFTEVFFPYNIGDTTFQVYFGKEGKKSIPFEIPFGSDQDTTTEIQRFSGFTKFIDGVIGKVENKESATQEDILDKRDIKGEINFTEPINTYNRTFTSINRDFRSCDATKTSNFCGTKLNIKINENGDFVNIDDNKAFTKEQEKNIIPLLRAKVSGRIFNDMKTFDDKFNVPYDNSNDEHKSKGTEINKTFLNEIKPIAIDPFFATEQKDKKNSLVLFYGASGSGKTFSSRIIMDSLFEQLDKELSSNTNIGFNIYLFSDYLDKFYDYNSELANNKYKYTRNDSTQNTLEKYYNTILKDGQNFSSFIEQVLKEEKTEEDIQAENKFKELCIFDSVYRAGFDIDGTRVLGRQNYSFKANEIDPKHKQFCEGELTSGDNRYYTENISNIIPIEINSKDEIEKKRKEIDGKIKLFRGVNDTGLNAESSRSHLIMMVIRRKKSDNIEYITESIKKPGNCFCLIDLAGTEDLNYLFPKNVQDNLNELMKNQNYTTNDWAKLNKSLFNPPEPTSRDPKVHLPFYTLLTSEYINMKILSTIVENDNTELPGIYDIILRSGFPMTEPGNIGVQVQGDTPILQGKKTVKNISTIVGREENRKEDKNIIIDIYGKKVFDIKTLGKILKMMCKESEHINKSLDDFKELLQEVKDQKATNATTDTTAIAKFKEFNKIMQDIQTGNMTDEEKTKQLEKAKGLLDEANSNRKPIEIKRKYTKKIVELLIKPIGNSNPNINIVGTINPRRSDDYNSYITVRSIASDMLQTCGNIPRECF